jgi:Domain of unknown function (DUF4249)
MGFLKRIPRFFIYLLLSLAAVTACVEPYEIKIKVDTAIITIDASLSDADQDQYISIKKTLPSQNSGVGFIQEKGAEVSVLENSVAINCKETSPGLYYMPAGFKTKLGATYQLKVKLLDGNQYESTVEKMVSTPDITGFTSVYDPKAIITSNNPKPGHLIYLDTKDNPEKGDNLLWRWRLWENQNVCKTCDGGLFLTSPAPTGRCLPVRALTEAGINYDYICSTKCWEILYSSDLNVISDIYSNGKEIKNRLVARVPFYQAVGFLIEVSQQNVNSNAFQYIKLLIEQNQKSGSLIDSPPAALIGNVRNIKNSKEAIGGYFMVGNIKSKRLWVPRVEDTPAQYLLGRANNPEPPGTDIERPPLSPCIRSLTRTPIKPEGWPF